jgi:hypothetical protein
MYSDKWTASFNKPQKNINKFNWCSLIITEDVKFGIEVIVKISTEISPQYLIMGAVRGTE